MKKIKIAHLLNPNIGLYGKEKWLLALLKYVDREYIDSIVICIVGDESVDLIDCLGHLDIAVMLVRTNSKFSIRAARKIADIVKNNKIDILHSHDHKSDFFALCARYYHRVFTLSTPHGYSDERDLKLRFYELLDRRLLKYFDYVSPLSTQLLNSLSKTVAKDKMKLIKNFVDMPHLEDSTYYNRKLVSSVGRLTPLKRIEDAIRAIALISDSEVRLQIIGDGKIRANLERIAYARNLEDRVMFYGFRKDVLQLMNESAILVIPSSTEGISRVAMEAMSMGKPVVASDIPGNRDIIEDGYNGILVPVGDLEGMARSIEELISDRNKYESLSRAAKNTIAEKFSAAVRVKDYEELYKSIYRNS